METVECQICVQPFSSSSTTILSCGHVFHEHCMKRYYLERPILESPEIAFGNKRCPLCRVLITHASCSEISREAENVHKTFNEIFLDAKSNLVTLKLELPEKTREVELYERVLNGILYCRCYKCKHPFFYSFKDCIESDKKQLKPEDVVCNKCKNIKLATCPKHGSEYIMYKCKYCCEIAFWVCGGIHWCQSCHSNSGVVSSLPKDQLPKCDPMKCPTGVDHSGNGEEFPLGCTLCRNNSATQ
eukprot:TRINITY_DN122387_c1_g1_i1.p1 TRINITY_DN122387_c1_g1~~TRINITY_DN122387_c1_g1_i1.p1  ORF type:complete len:243 (-),score=5.52 TRINITY_DN122387_c1_g1_i1:87-815(-)